jgi:hypothetical protein
MRGARAPGGVIDQDFDLDCAAAGGHSASQAQRSRQIIHVCLGYFRRVHIEGVGIYP